MKKRRWQFLALGMAAVSLAGPVALPVYAEVPQVTKAVIDTQKTGSITLYKYAAKDGESVPGTGAAQDVSGIAGAPIAGVTFSYVKIGEIADAGEAGDLGLYYQLSDAFLAFLSGDAVKALPEAVRIGGKDYYTSDSINDALLSVQEKSYAGEDSGETLLADFTKEAEGAGSITTDESGKAEAGDLPLGLYLVAETAYPAQESAESGEAADGAVIAAPSRAFLVSLPMTNVTDITDEDGTHPAGTLWQYDVTAYPKNTVLRVTKEIVADGNDREDADPEKAYDRDGLVRRTDKSVGDVVTFVTTASVPKLVQQADGTEVKNRKYEIRDVMTDGLTFRAEDQDALSVTLGTGSWSDESNEALVSGMDYTLEAGEDGHSFTCTLTEAGLAKLDALSADANLFVKYTALVNGSAAEGTGSVKETSNEVSVTYGTSISPDAVIRSDTPKIYTYEIDISKSFSKAEGADLSKVKFSISADGKTLAFMKEADGTYTLSDGRGAEAAETVSPDADGKLRLKGLDAGTYVVTEVATAPGFNLLKDSVTVALSADHEETGALTSASVSAGEEMVEISDAESLARGVAAFGITNNETITTLRTGGAGVGVPVAVGISCVAAGSAVFVFAARKRKKPEGKRG